MIEKPNLNEKVLINRAEGHRLPLVLEQAELPVPGIVVGPAGESDEDDLFIISVPDLHDGKVQLHREQLFAGPEENPHPEPASLDELREALETIGAAGAPQSFNAEDPQEWAVLIVSAAANSEGHGDSVLQDLLIDAIGKIIGAPPGEDGHGLAVAQMAMRALRPSWEEMFGFLGLLHPHDTSWYSSLRQRFQEATGEQAMTLPALRPRRVLILEAPDDDFDLTEGLELGEVVMGSMSLVADADEVFVFRGDKAVAGKHRDNANDDVNVAIQRRADDRVEFTVKEAQALADSFMGGSPDGEALNSATPKLEAILGKELG